MIGEDDQMLIDKGLLLDISRSLRELNQALCGDFSQQHIATDIVMVKTFVKRVSVGSVVDTIDANMTELVDIGIVAGLFNAEMVLSRIDTELKSRMRDDALDLNEAREACARLRKWRNARGDVGRNLDALLEDFSTILREKNEEDPVWLANRERLLKLHGPG